MIGVLGGTGYTGGEILRLLAKKDVPVTLFGRSRSSLEALKQTYTNIQHIKELDIRNLSFPAPCFNELSVLINAAGPYTAQCEPVIQACIHARTHYVDITAEQHFQETTLEKYQREAAENKVVCMTGHGCDFAFAYCAMAKLRQAQPTLKHFESFYHLENFKVSRGTAKSALNMLAHDIRGFLAPKFVTIEPHLRSFPPNSDLLGVAFPGGDAIVTPMNFANVETYNAYLLLSPKEARNVLSGQQSSRLKGLVTSSTSRWLLEKLIKIGLPNPSTKTRQSATWKATVAGKIHPESQTSHYCSIAGSDVYGVTAAAAITVALKLWTSPPAVGGFQTTHRVIAIDEFLSALSLYNLKVELGTYQRKATEIETTKSI